MIHVKISLNIRNYEFPGVDYTGLSPVALIGASHVGSKGVLGESTRNLKDNHDQRF